MHDPMTGAFEIKYPWLSQWPDGTPYRPTFVTIWHVDPEKGGSDDSCDWWGKRRPLNKKERALYEAIDDLRHTLGNEPFYPNSRLYGSDHLKFPHEEGDDIGLIGKLDAALYNWRQRSRFRIPVRWHVWHWEFQCHPLQDIKRFLFTRCRVCGGRFKWKEGGLGTWHGTGPLWFRSEQLTHMNGLCDAIGVPGVLEPQSLPGAPG